MSDLSRLREELGLNKPKSTSPWRNAANNTGGSGGSSGIQRQLVNKLNEEAERKKREEERRQAQMDAIQSYDGPKNVEASPIATPGQAKPSSYQRISDSQQEEYTPQDRRKMASRQGSPDDLENVMKNSDVIKNHKNNVMRPYNDYRRTIGQDLEELKQYSRTPGVWADDIPDQLLAEDTKVEEKLEKIASKLQAGKEGKIKNIQEGWYEKEVQNMISKETVREMNGLPNKLTMIEDWMEEHPELGYSGEFRNKGEEWFDKGTRFAMGSLPKQMVDSYSHALKQPGTYAWMAAAMAASLLAAPVTGGASLATAPLLISQMPLLTKSVASMKPAAAVALGMRMGSYDNMANLEMTSSYNELIEAGVDKRIAVPIAATVGGFNGIVENLQMDGALSMIPGFDDLVTKGSKLVQNELVRQIGTVAKNYGVEVLTESLEEAMQAGVSDLGLSLGKYMKDAPDPSTLGGLKAMGERVTGREFWEIVSLEGYEAMKSMWLSPLLSSAGRTMAGEGAYRVSEHRKQHELIFGKEGVVDEAVDAVVKDKNTEAMDMLLVQKHIFEEVANNETTLKRERKDINNAAKKIDTTLGDVMYEAKITEPTIDYKPSNVSEVSDMFLQDDFRMDQIERSNAKANDYTLELYRSADNHNVLSTIKEGLVQKKSKSEILNEITKVLPKKQRGQVEVMTMINAVEIMTDEARSQSILNSFVNLKIAQAVLDQKPRVETEIIMDDNIDTTGSDLTQEVDMGDSIALTQEEDLTMDDTGLPIAMEPVTVDAMEDMQETTVETVPKEELIKEEPIKETILPEGKYKPADNVIVPVKDIHVDPESFQFRYDQGNESGATRKLDGAEYNPMLAGSILLWQDEHGDLYVVNGHHRLDLAKKDGVQEVTATIVTHEQYSKEDARSLGAMINIAEDNATSIDVAKLIRDTGASEADFKELGVKSDSKIARDGRALSQLNDWIFTNVATRAIPLERAVIIGREFAGNEDGQNQMLNIINKDEAAGKTITNKMLTEMIAQVKGTAQEVGVQQTLMGEETYTRNFATERAEIVVYVKDQLKSKVSILKNVSKEKNAALLSQLGNTIAVEDNVKEMNIADQGLWMLDKSLNWKGGQLNTFFNDLAKEYADAKPSDRMSIKKQALAEFTSMMEGGKLFDDILNSRDIGNVADAGQATMDLGPEAGQTTMGMDESIVKTQTDLLGQETMMQLESLPEVSVVIKGKAKKSSVYKKTEKILEGIKKNPIFRGMEIEYSDEASTKIWTRSELDEAGYKHFKEGPITVQGNYTTISELRGRVVLNNEGNGTTIVEESIHHIQANAERISPEFAKAVSAWENAIQEKAKELNLPIPDGVELFAQAYVFGELGHADKGSVIADLVAIDDDLVNMIEDLLGPEIINAAKGKNFSEVAKANRALRTYNQLKEEIEITNNMLSHHSGQSDMLLSAIVDGKVVGKLEYSDYKGEPAISFIEVPEAERRKGIATELLKELQSSYPNVDIDWGYTTEDGSALKEAITYEIPNKEIMADIKKLTSMKEQLKAIDERIAQEIYLEEDGEIYNALYDEISLLEKDLVGKNPIKTMIDTNLQLTAKDHEGELLAVHNITETNLQQALELDGFPMPSIAIVKKDAGYSNFGPISLVFKKDTIDPSNKDNRVFSMDAWTPTFPTIQSNINHIPGRYLELVEGLENGDTEFSRTVLMAEIEGIMQRFKDRPRNIPFSLADHPAVQYMFLKEKGKLNMDEYNNQKDTDAYLKKEVNNNSKYFNEVFEFAKELYRQIEVSDVVFDENSNMFAATPDNILKVMQGGKDIRNAEGATGSTKFLLDIAKEFTSIEDIRNFSDNLSQRENSIEDQSKLRTLYRTAIEKIIDFSDVGYGDKTYETTVQDKLVQVVKRYNDKDVMNQEQGYEAIDNLMEEAGLKTNQILNERIFNLIEAANVVTVDLFEAKPQRVVDFNEIQAVLVPMDVNPELEAALRAKGINLIEKYDKGGKIGWRKFGEDNYNVNIQDTDKNIIFNESALSMEDIRYEIGDQYANEILNSTEKHGLIQAKDRQKAMDEVLRQNDVSFQLKEADTNTEEFKKWFKDSKVVNNDGKPMAVYHGSPNAFDTFRPSNAIGWGEGIYFTDNQLAASEYGYKEDGSNLYKVYLDIQNPYTGDVNLSYEDIEKTRVYRRTYDKMIEKGYDDYDIDAREMFNEDGDFANKVIRELGYDGIIMEGSNNINGKEIVVFNPTQIKSADNRGTWDATDPNMYYQMKEVFEKDLLEGDFELSSWKETVENSKFTDPELVELLQSEQLYYEVMHNKNTMLAAARMIDDKGKEWVHARVMGDVQNDAVVFAAAQILIAQYQSSGQYELAREMIYKTSEKATSAGQAIQILSQWNRQSAPGMARMVAGQYEKLMTGKDKENVNKLAIGLTGDINNINKGALENIDMTETINKIKDMTPEEMLARRIANTLSAKDVKKKDAMQTMIDTLFKIAEESPLPERENKPTNPMEFIVAAIVNRDEYTDVWDKAREVLTEQFKDDPGKMESLKDYFDNDFLKTVADSHLKKVVGSELSDMNIRIRDIVKKHYTEGQKVTDTLVNKLVSETGLTGAEADMLAKYIADEMEKQTKEAKESLLKQTFKGKTIKGERQSLDQKILEMSNLGAFSDKSYKHLIAEKIGLPSLSDEMMELIFEKAEYIQTLEEGSRERDVETALLMNEVSKGIPVSNWTKASTLQAMSHLLNVRTTARNLVGNEIFSKVDTINNNYMGAGIDTLMSLFTGQRTTAHRNLLKLLGTQYQAYGQEFKIGVEDAKLGINTSEANSKFNLNAPRTFGNSKSNSKVIQAMDRGLSGAETIMDITMRATDRAAQSAAFADSIQEQLLLSGLEVPTQQMIDNANQLGAYRTFNDVTALSTGFNNIKKGLNLISSIVTKTTDFGLGDIFIKYASTPANIIARGIDYSPIGVVQSAFEFVFDKSGDPYMKQKMFVEGVSRGLSGTVYIAAGALLASLGMVTGGNPDEDEDIYKLKKQYGLADYAINTSAAARQFLSGFQDHKAGELRPGDNIVTYDWAEPFAMMIAVGADTVLGTGDPADMLATVVNAMEAGATTLTDQPLLTGMSKLFAYGDPVKGVSSGIADLPSSFTPSLFGHIANAMDGSNKNAWDFYPKGRQIYNAVIRKLPGLKSQLPDRYSVLGEKLEYYPEDTGIAQRVLKSAVSPANYGEYRPSKAAQLVFDLYEATDSTDHIPRSPKKSYKLEDDMGDIIEYTFTPQSYARISKWVGNEYEARVNYAMKHYMQDWTAHDQVEEIKFIIKDLGADTEDKVREWGKIVK